MVLSRLPFSSSTPVAACLVATLALTACGGGGGAPSPTPEPQATDKSTPVSGSFATIESRSFDGTTSKTQVQIVDISKGVIAQRYDVGSNADYPSKTWTTIYQVTMDADGLGYQQAGASQFAFIQAGKVMLLDLTGTTLGTARQLSNVADACNMARDPDYLSPDGRHAWLRITTAGPDGQCATSPDNLVSLVSTDMTVSDTAVASGTTSGLHIVAPLRDIAGQAQNLLVLDRSRAALVVYSNDLKTLRYPVTAPTLAGTEAARVLSLSPTNYQQALLQIGTNVYLADWSAAPVSLSAPILTTPLRYALANSTLPVVARSTDRFYLGDGIEGYAISSSGHLLAHFTFPADHGDIAEVALTNYGVVVNQTIQSSSSSGGSSATPSGSSSVSTGAGSSTSVAATPSTPPVSTLWSINGITGEYVGLVHSNDSAVFHLLSAHGDTVLFGQSNAAGLPSNAIFKVSATNSFAPQTVASGINLIDVALNPHSGSGHTRAEKLLWCTPTTPSGTVGCASSTVKTYDTTSEQPPTTIGTMAAAASTASSRLFGVQETWTTRNSLVELIQYSQVGSSLHYTSDIWMLNPSIGNSLQRLTPLP